MEIIATCASNMKRDYLQQLFDATYHGKYNFHDFIAGDISQCYEKFEVNGRLIHNPNTKIKAYHVFLNLFLCRYLNVNTDVVFSYRKGFNTYSAVAKHASNKYFFQTDLIDFFQRLNFGLIEQTLLDGREACPILDLTNHIERITELVTVDKKIPRGFATSPLISNACLFEFDNDLASICANLNLTYTRYSDDIIISSMEKKEIFGIEEKIQSSLQKHFGNDLTINQSKSKLSSTADRVSLLGMNILPNGKVSIDSKLRKKIEVHLHFYSSDKEKFLTLVKGDSKAGLEKISGWVNYASTIDPFYLDKLRKKYGATVVDMFVHNSAQ